PKMGEVIQGTQLQIAYYDQLRASLDDSLTAAENVSGGRENVMVNGKERHIMSYMQDFMFDPARARAPITALSGGETGRLMLAKLFLQPSNLMVLDEPSNDLDIETLELLESLLAEYQGTIILISHDRELIENVVTRSLVYQGNGKFVEVAGGYQDFERELSQSSVLKPVFEDDKKKQNAAPGPATVANNPNKPAQKSKPPKLSYKQRLELDKLPETIASIESTLADIHKAMSQADFYKDKDSAETTITRASTLQDELDEAYSRWEELESIHTGAGQ
ncbi:MAG: ATP-binding cassette domain-containing protein, partial [Granulosicoccus sp.]|nr:ATP-binding cassette domain-containing protein [Granulosicoccus sp.]